MGTSSSQFAYPSTVIKYVDNPRRSPVESLKQVLECSKRASNKQNPLAELDALYTLILHPPDVDPPFLCRLLHGHIAMQNKDWLIYTFQLDSFFSLQDGSILLPKFNENFPGAI